MAIPVTVNVHQVCFKVSSATHIPHRRLSRTWLVYDGFVLEIDSMISNGIWLTPYTVLSVMEKHMDIINKNIEKYKYLNLKGMNEDMYEVRNRISNGHYAKYKLNKCEEQTYNAE